MGDDFNITDGVLRDANIQGIFTSNADRNRPFLADFRGTPYPNGASITVQTVDDSDNESEREDIIIFIDGYSNDSQSYRSISAPTSIRITILDND